MADLAPTARTALERPARISWLARCIGIARLSPTASIGLLIILSFGFMAVGADLIMPYDPEIAFAERVLEAPSERHIFGTDGNGMDVFSRVIYGSRFGFGIAIPAVLIALVIGVPVGLFTGY